MLGVSCGSAVFSALSAVLKSLDPLKSLTWVCSETSFVVGPHKQLSWLNPGDQSRSENVGGSILKMGPPP